MKKYLILLTGVLVCFHMEGLRAQTRSGNAYPEFEKLVENLLPPQEENVDYNDLYDRLFSLYTHHLNLNEADRGDLESLYMLSDAQIDRLLEYKKKYGSLLSAYELLTIPGFDRRTVEQLLFFVDITAPENNRGHFRGKMLSPFQHDLLIRTGRIMERSNGFVTPDSLKRFQGTPWHMMMRYTLARRGSYSLGFTVEQDPGEKILWRPKAGRYGMDYWSFHVMIENRGIVKKFILGDYALGFGQDLVLGSGFRTGKGLEAVQGIRRNNPGIKPYRSVFERRDFSGAAMTLGAGHFFITGFGSVVNRDAVVKSDTLRGEDPYVSYIRNTGLHRNVDEMKARHSITETAAGFNFQYRALKDRIVLGVNGVKTFYNKPVVPDARKYNRFALSGAGNTAGSFYGTWTLKHFSFFGEAALSEGGGTGMVGGLLAELSSYAGLSVVYRKYSRDFHTLYGNAFGEDYRNNNEEGLYIGLRVQPVRRLFFTFFLDRFYFPWLRYRADGPSEGYEMMTMADYRPSDAWTLRLEFRMKSKELNGVSGTEPVRQLRPALKQWLRLDADWKSAGVLGLRSRVLVNSYDFCGRLSRGFLIAQDVLVNGNRIFARGRLAYFNTDDYDTRQFIYEQDLLYMYSVPFFYGEGWRYYVVTGLHLLPEWTIWLKLAQTRYRDKPGGSHGPDEIPGNVRTECRLQLRIKF